MKYFIDFDRTVFDTDSFKRSLEKRPTLLELASQFKAAVQEFFAPTSRTFRRRLFLKTWGTFLSHGRFSLSSDEMRSFLYPDAIAFMKVHDCTIVTYGVRAFVTAKVTTALGDTPLTDIVYTSRKKGRTLRRLTKEEEEPCAFVDDMIFQLDSVSRWCPDIKVIEIRRDAAPGDGRWPVIRSFEEVV